MSNANTYQAAAVAYADSVRVLFAPIGIAAGDRGGHGPASTDEVTAQAEQLSPLSVTLTKATEDQLHDPDPRTRADAATRLLAKALTDLEISAHLLQAAKDEENHIAWADSKTTDRTVASSAGVEEPLRILLGASDGASDTDRASGAVDSRTSLADSVADALVLIRKRAGKTSQTAVEGILAIGLLEIGQAVGQVAMSGAELLGQADAISKLYNLFRSFVTHAYDAIVALLGAQALQKVADAVVGWVKQLDAGEVLDVLLEKLYQTEQTKRQLDSLVRNSQANSSNLSTAIEQVNGLNDRYGRQLRLVEKLLRGLKFLGLVPAATLPGGTMLLTGTYVMLAGYVVCAGGDFVDAPKVQLLSRVDGVRTIVERELKT